MAGLGQFSIGPATVSCFVAISSDLATGIERVTNRFAESARFPTIIVDGNISASDADKVMRAMFHINDRFGLDIGASPSAIRESVRQFEGVDGCTGAQNFVERNASSIFRNLGRIADGIAAGTIKPKLPLLQIGLAAGLVFGLYALMKAP